jgi:septation ring formation regulator EzrA
VLQRVDIEIQNSSILKTYFFTCAMSQEELTSARNALTDISNELNQTKQELANLNSSFCEKNDQHQRLVTDFDNTKRYLEVSKKTRF